jgi:hypothetical protein
MSDIEFVPGLIVKQRASNAPDYVICKLSIKPQELAAWLNGKAGEWVNVDVKVSKSGKAYAAVDNWKPEAQNSRPAARTAPAKAAPTGRRYDDMDDCPF